MKKFLFIMMIVALILGCGTTSSSTASSDMAADGGDAGAAMAETPRRAIPPTMAVEGVATVDGVLDDAEWAAAVKYPLAYNQLNQEDLRPPKDRKDISGNWSVMFSGNMLYGYVTRTDDVLFLDAGNIWENDCIELFLDVDGSFSQIRALVGEDFDGGTFPATAVWSADGSVVEFSVELPMDMAGKIIGWTLALADNDGEGRDYQLYPINGQNDSWQGVNLGSLAFGEGATGDANMVIPFRANAGTGITVDGNYSDDEWAAAVKYQFCYNQLNTADETMNPDYKDLYGDWGLVYEGNMLYGFVNRSDDVTVTTAPNVWDNDTVEVFLDIAGTFSQIRTVVGEGWGGGTYAAEAVWSADGKVLEFSCDLGTAAADLGIIGFSIALADDDDGTNREQQLYPVYGFNDGWQGKNLAELEFMK